MISFFNCVGVPLRKSLAASGPLRRSVGCTVTTAEDPEAAAELASDLMRALAFPMLLTNGCPVRCAALFTQLLEYRWLLLLVLLLLLLLLQSLLLPLQLLLYQLVSAPACTACSTRSCLLSPKSESHLRGGYTVCTKHPSPVHGWHRKQEGVSTSDDMARSFRHRWWGPSVVTHVPGMRCGAGMRCAPNHVGP